MSASKFSETSDGRRKKSGDADAVTTLRNELGELAEVRSYRVAREPILAPILRVAVHQWLTELRYEPELRAVGAKARKKLLLSGPPGTGKTTLAHHLAARMGIPLVLVGPENIVGKYLGDTTSAISKLFAALLKTEQQCVLFMDEIDALGASRDSHGEGSASAERKNAMTVMLRKFEEYDGLLVAATNRPDSLDTALWRRFDMHLTVDLPRDEERWSILKQYSLPFDLDDDGISVIADLTRGASPALLEGLMTGMKRSLVINPKMGLSIDDPKKVFAPIVNGLKPPPEIASPALWTTHGLDGLDDLAAFWPPTLKKEPDPTC